MPATVTLSSTTLGKKVNESQRSVRLASTSGLIPGLWFFCDGELMAVVSLGIASEVNVLRGVGGTRAAEHPSAAVVYFGRPDQFFTYDPVGLPPQAIPVSPHINVANGAVWFATQEGEARRWEKQVPTYSVGPLGVNVVTLSPAAST